LNPFITALVPILALIFIGYGLKRSAFLSQEAWAGMEKLTYYILFPALLIHTLGNQTIADSTWPSILLVVSVTLLLSTTLLIVWHNIGKSINGATFTSIFQGGVRFNTYIALAVASGFFGKVGLDLSSIAAGFMIVIVNLFCIGVFAIFGTQQLKGFKPVMREVVINPLIIACAIGWFLSLSSIGLPFHLGDILKIVGQAALPFGLLAVGASLRLSAVRGHVKSIALSSIVQFMVKPVTAIVLINHVGLTGITASVLIVMFMVPTAPSAYILARQLGGDTETMSSIITFQTLLAFLVMPLIAWITMN